MYYCCIICIVCIIVLYRYVLLYYYIIELFYVALRVSMALINQSINQSISLPATFVGCWFRVIIYCYSQTDKYSRPYYF